MNRALTRVWHTTDNFLVKPEIIQLIKVKNISHYFSFDAFLPLGVKFIAHTGI